MKTVSTQAEPLPKAHRTIAQWLKNRTTAEKKTAVILMALMAGENSEIENIAQEAYSQWQDEILFNSESEPDFIIGVATGL